MHSAIAAVEGQAPRTTRSAPRARARAVVRRAPGAAATEDGKLRKLAALPVEELDEPTSDESMNDDALEALAVNADVERGPVDKAKVDALVREHIGLVRLVARRYSIDPSHYEDMLQEGALGIMRAAETFDVKFSVKFSTYATFWIRTRIQRYLAAVRGHEFGAPASVAWACGRTRGKSGVRALARSVSLDDTSGTDGKRALEEVIAGDSPDPEAYVSGVEMRARVVGALHTAARKLNDPRTALLIEQRLLSDEPATLAEIGAALDLSREGARLLESRLLKLAKKELEVTGVAA
jgi:RNA polymerase sigma factor (sigma-70 family)